MEAQKRRAFFIDIDGTLINSKNRTLTENTKKTFLKAKENGALFFINTARPRFSVPEEIFPSEIFDGICSGCGTHILFHGKTLCEHFMPEDLLLLTAKYAIEGLKEGAFYFEGFDRNYYIGKTNEWIEQKGFLKINSPEDFLTKYKGVKIQKFSTGHSTVFDPAVFKKCERYFNIMYHPDYTEGYPFGFGKGAAIRLTEEHLGLDHDLTVAIGDSVNDLDMLTYAGTSVAMGNSEECIKELCDMVTLISAEEGVAYAVKKIMELDNCYI